tara:strand:+ start:5751 stop:6641 length:891 start_codon:yes stop_codon:yes gene_type:complete
MTLTKGIILAGGNGSRLFPLTKGISKHLLPVYDKPMIYYPLSVLMKAGIKEILIISTPKDIPSYKNIFGDGTDLGLSIFYKPQTEPNGIAEAFIIGENFINSNNICLILGDNIFYGKALDNLLISAKNNLLKDYSTIFSIQTENPNQFGVIRFSKKGDMIEIVEKPKENIGNRIVSGIYFYTNDVVKAAKKLKPSSRGELEITDINNYYLNKSRLKCLNLDSSFFWSDTGTYDSLLKASKFFYNIELETSKKVSCIEEIALEKFFIDKSKFEKVAKSMASSDYGKYLLSKIKKIEK